MMNYMVALILMQFSDFWAILLFFCMSEVQLKKKKKAHHVIVSVFQAFRVKEIKLF